MPKRPIFETRSQAQRSPSAWLLVACALAVACLAASSVQAQIPTTAPSPAFSCAKAVQVDPEIRAAGLPGDPVLSAERLLYEASELVGPVEVRYRVAGTLFATETADLTPNSERARSSQLTGESDEMRVEPSRVVDLLALRPDVLRRLRAKVVAGEAVTVTVVANGLTLETVTLEELTRRSGELLNAPTVAVRIVSEVTGPGTELAPVPVADTVNGCGTCGPTVPCDADGPFDEGKGDCVGCAEIGDCDPGPCACSTVLQDYWTGWYETSSTPLSQWGCVDRQLSADERARLHFVNYRRNRIQVVRICPSCPSCTGCYNQQQVVDYQTDSDYCYKTYIPPEACLGFDPTIYPHQLCI